MSAKFHAIKNQKNLGSYMKLKFSEKATKICRKLHHCFDIYLVTSKIRGFCFSNFVAFSEYMKKKSREVSTEPERIEYLRRQLFIEALIKN